MIRKYYSTNKQCLICNHYNYCQVYWGSECKRQSGNRTPRLKGKHFINNTSIQPKHKSDSKHKQPSLNKYETIKTRRVNWAFHFN